MDLLIASAEFGSPLTSLDLRLVVKQYLEKEGIRVRKFHNNTPGKDWCLKFLERHKDRLNQRHCQNIKRSRAEKTEEELERYFTNLEENLAGVPAENILNYDETNLTDNPGSKKYIFSRGSKYPKRVVNATKSAISIMFAATASGEVLPPYIVYKAERIYDQWCIGGPKNARYNRTKSGWFDSFCFEDWFSKIIVPWAKNHTGPKVVIGDNLSSHLNLSVLLECQRNNIRFIFLPPNSTHLTQPLDVSFFRPLKIHWRNILLDYKMRNPRDQTLNKSSFPSLLKRLMNEIKANEASVIKNGFRATGIYPLNKNEVLKRMPNKRFENKVFGKIDDTLLNYLKETRSPSVSNSRQTRKKMIRVVPGKSVSLEDLEHKETGSVSPVPGTSAAEVDSCSEDVDKTVDETVDEAVDEMDDEVVNETVDETVTVKNTEEATETNVAESAKTGDFIIVAFRGKKSLRHFAGKVLNIDGNDWNEVKFLRHKTGNKFAFPDIEDISHIMKTEIIKVLPKPDIFIQGNIQFQN